MEVWNQEQLSAYLSVERKKTKKLLVQDEIKNHDE
jgi:hypothetical protein